MGSLMAGWQIPVKDPNFVRVMRNKSLTKERIQDYWNLKRKTEEEHLKSISPVVKESLTEEACPNEHKRKKSLPMIGGKRSKLESSKESETNLQALKNYGWWTRSNWAFLNEPPLIAGEVAK